MKLGEVIKFLKEVREELKRVSWPSKELVRNATVAVIVFTIILSVYLWSLDLIFKRIFDFIFR
ncbi:MAG: preprotein translocase subunit SecE [Persephonella sp.]|nr:MAG: preprotein translocase subunit SecE [Persephonella sp.]